MKINSNSWSGLTSNRGEPACCGFDCVSKPDDGGLYTATGNESVAFTIFGHGHLASNPDEATRQAHGESF